jgi:hypothetical protein
MCIGINYDEDQCKSIVLQAIKLSGGCVCGCVCVHVHVCVLWGYVYVVINFRLPTWEYKGNIGMLEH